MSKVNCDMSMSVDGFVAGPNQSLANPFGDGIGDRLHRWMFEEPEANAAEIQGVTAAGAFIMGRNMFGPGRHDWDLDWKGWWGDDPPYHGPVFVLTHHPRPTLPMDGGTTFTFVTDGIESAMAQAHGGGREGHRDRRRRAHGEPVPGGGADRRAPPACRAGDHRRGRAAVRRRRRPRPRAARCEGHQPGDARALSRGPVGVAVNRC